MIEEESEANGARELAKPPVRKLARDLGIDLATLTGTGPQGSITRQDVRAAQSRTEAGLLVPNVKDAGRLSLRELADAVNQLVASARSGKTAPEDMAGDTLTIINVGVFGIDSGTPILPPRRRSSRSVPCARPRGYTEESRDKR